MSLPRMLLNLAVTLAVLAPSAALAGDFHRRAVAVASTPVGFELRVGQPAPGIPRNSGHYELRPVNRWVEGRYEEYYVAGRCEVRRHHRHPRHARRYCTEGYLAQRWVPGHYVQASEYVWVPHAPVYQRPVVSFGFNTAGL